MARVISIFIELYRVEIPVLKNTCPLQQLATNWNMLVGT